MANYDLFAWLDQENPNDHTGFFLGSLTAQQVIALSPSLVKAQQAHDISLPVIGRAQLRRSSVRALMRIFEEHAAVQQDPVVGTSLAAALSIFRVASDLRVGIVWTTP
ncbi:hypothetical protein [Deinococcus navajonensis]|uniref:Uncharacterized protein n=1 Tax=Deinococcus navajonensis TaxID=309884 RepID=A0ABV8XGX4_9DEIO